MDLTVVMQRINCIFTFVITGGQMEKPHFGSGLQQNPGIQKPNWGHLHLLRDLSLYTYHRERLNVEDSNTYLHYSIYTLYPEYEQNQDETQHQDTSLHEHIGNIFFLLLSLWALSPIALVSLSASLALMHGLHGNLFCMSVIGIMLPLTKTQLIQRTVHKAIQMYSTFTWSQNLAHPDTDNLPSQVCQTYLSFPVKDSHFSLIHSGFQVRTVLTGQKHLADSYGNCEQTQSQHLLNLSTLLQLGCERNSWQTHFTCFCLCFSVFSHILFSSAESLCRGNEVDIIIVVVELFTSDFGYNETLVM